MGLLYNLRLTDNVIKRRAPPGLMFRIDGVSFSNKTALAGAFVYLVDRWFPQNISDSVGVDVANILAAMDITLAGQNHMVNNINEKAKYITLAKTDAASCNTVVAIYGEFVKASRVELIVEFLRRFS